jgi:hypothetical protein
VQFDLKDAVTVPADLEGKQQHVVEIANFIDAGCTGYMGYSFAKTAFKSVVTVAKQAQIEHLSQSACMLEKKRVRRDNLCSINLSYE